jgi:hypothetical protein
MCPSARVTIPTVANTAYTAYTADTSTSTCGVSASAQRQRLHSGNLAQQELLLVEELLVVGAVVEEVPQELGQLLAVVHQDLVHFGRLVRIGHEDLTGENKINGRKGALGGGGRGISLIKAVRR